MKVSAVLLCIVILMSAVACGSSVSKAPNGMTADEIISNCQNVSSSMNTMQIYSTTTMSYQGDKDVANVSGSLDNLNRSVYALSHDSALPNASKEIYALDKWIYTCNSTGKWIKTELTEDIWNQTCRVQQWLGIMQNYTKASFIGMESVNGTNCYEIDIIPSESSEINALGLSLGGVTIKSQTFDVWIAEDNYYPAKLAFNLTASDGVGLNEILTYLNINQPVNITLPEAANGATALSNTEWEKESSQ